VNNRGIGWKNLAGYELVTQSDPAPPLKKRGEDSISRFKKKRGVFGGGGCLWVWGVLGGGGVWGGVGWGSGGGGGVGDPLGVFGWGLGIVLGGGGWGGWGGGVGVGGGGVFGLVCWFCGGVVGWVWLCWGLWGGGVGSGCFWVEEPGNRTYSSQEAGLGS